ncbi:hypothetical protein LMG19083_01362 [Ralstonia psammae]|uniref:HTH merR-type domain-containing protein n=1 Tax=Ralstonia psammae TaxID=3058598 RepID=A0ABM9J8Q1_9RALS|nr:MerR family transcriptional regulator [Ralstonia sp. LMG 19083]CAJ0785959.1 hypothetical protein LMG19083_01362 [Ralstonia sp. LMG 19083]
MGKHDTSIEPRRYRSGEAARLARMPAATLRIWERRYAVVSPPKTASGQRRYSDEDVRRLRLIKTLVNQGHPISAIAGLDWDALTALMPPPDDTQPELPETFSLLVVGHVDMPSTASAFGNVRLCAHARSLEDAFEYAHAGVEADALLVSVPSLRDETFARIVALSDALHAKAVSVVYGFGSSRATELAGLAGVRVVRRVDTQAKPAHLIAELADWAMAHRQADRLNVGTGPRAMRRFDDRTLASLAGIASAIRCECPRHLAELVLQLSAFQRYSDECTSRSPGDALLHRRLGNVANRAVQLLETALAEIVRQEGLMNRELLRAI